MVRVNIKGTRTMFSGGVEKGCTGNEWVNKALF